jgi:hypothetical protein
MSVSVQKHTFFSVGCKVTTAALLFLLTLLEAILIKGY